MPDPDPHLFFFIGPLETLHGDVQSEKVWKKSFHNFYFEEITLIGKDAYSRK